MSISRPTTKRCIKYPGITYPRDPVPVRHFAYLPVFFKNNMFFTILGSVAPLPPPPPAPRAGSAPACIFEMLIIETHVFSLFQCCFISHYVCLQPCNGRGSATQMTLEVAIARHRWRCGKEVRSFEVLLCMPTAACSSKLAGTVKYYLYVHRK